MSKIDFVITWVDGKDPDWLEQYNFYKNDNINDHAKNNARFRDWENLIYWFRSVDKYCPWVRKIHLVTFGHYPNWLNINYEKINVVCHEDIIPKEFLPTFNSRVIAIYLNKIKDLSEKFVYFNDDTFINNYINEDYFFKKGLPNDTFQMFPLTQVGNNNHEGIVKHNCINIINAKFNKIDISKKIFFKIFNLNYTFYQNLSNLMNFPYLRFSYIKNFHMSQPFLKSVFDEALGENNHYLLNMSANKFRSKDDINLALVRYWALVQGKFNPVNREKNFKYYNITNENLPSILDNIKNSKDYELCLNDGEHTDNFDFLKDQINEMFYRKFPNKSAFEV